MNLEIYQDKKHFRNFWSIFIKLAQKMRYRLLNTSCKFHQNPFINKDFFSIRQSIENTMNALTGPTLFSPLRIYSRQRIKKEKTRKKLKIAISKSNIKIFENEIECDDLSSRGSLIPKISLLSKKLSPTRPILWPISIFQQNRKQFSNVLKMAIVTHQKSYKVLICQISSL